MNNYGLRVNRHEGDGWQTWSVLLTKEEAYKQARESRIWAKNSDLQWSFKIITTKTINA
jgi:hypothetical protein